MTKCKHCGENLYGKQKSYCCKEHKKAQYYIRNKPILLKKRKQYYVGNKEKVTISNARWKAENPERVLSYKRKWSKNNKSKKREYYLRKEANNPERRKRLTECQALRRKTPNGREAMKIENARRRLSKYAWLVIKKRTFKEDDEFKRQIITKLGEVKKCYYCDGDTCLSVDHIFPLSKGGCDELWNLTIACKSCNSKKHNTLPFEWAKIKNIVLPEDFLLNYKNCQGNCQGNCQNKKNNINPFIKVVKK